MPQLTKQVIDALAPRDKRYHCHDSELRGFAIRVETNGSKVFIVRYQAGLGRNAPGRLVTIGPSTVLTPQQARTKAKQLLAAVRLGGDPGGERRKQRAMLTFTQVATEMLDEAQVLAEANPEKAQLRPNTIRNYKSLLRRHVGPAIGSVKLDAITSDMVQQLHRRVGRKTPTNANRLLQFIGSVFKQAVTAGLVPVGTNPARGIKAYKEHTRERFLSIDELARLGAAIREAEVIGTPWQVTGKHVPKTNPYTKLNPFAAAGLRLLIISGARLREILHAKWTDIDFDRNVLTVIGKTGKRHILLTAPAIAILAELPRIGIYCIAGERAGQPDERPRADLNKPWRLVRDRAGLTGCRLHDLRHSHASLALAGGATLPIIGKILGHSNPAMTARYSHLADDPVRAAAEKTAATAAAALAGKEAVPATPLPQRKRHQ